ncbi:MAG: DnaJ domain-containing protein [Nitrospinae bacterium]|nr:DnaJ domain-containing protein [Nitrospinota bacterium]
MKSAYKKYALKYHPDRNKGGAEAFIAVSEAYRELMRGTPKKVVVKKPAPKKATHHDLSFVKIRLSRDKIWAPDYHLFQRPKVAVGNKRCETCGGTGKLLDTPGAKIVCAECKGTGLKTKITNI